MNRYLCVRNGPIKYGGPARIRTWDQLIMSQRQGETESTSEDPSDTEDEDLDEE